MIEITVNGQARQIEADADTPLLWVIREQLGLTGTKFGCGVGQCGACTVHLNGTPTRTCVFPAAAAAGQEVTTIEGLDHPVQAAWLKHQVPQCGYCQSGQLMAASGLLNAKPDPNDDEINGWMTNLCRCATYERIRAAIHTAAGEMPAPPEPEPEPEPEAVEGEAAEGEAGAEAAPAEDGGAQ